MGTYSDWEQRQLDAEFSEQLDRDDERRRRVSTTNSFQRWAIGYARAFGFAVTIKGNWVELTRGGETVECMTTVAVQEACK